MSSLFQSSLNMALNKGLEKDVIREFVDYVAGNNLLNQANPTLLANILKNFGRHRGIDITKSDFYKELRGYSGNISAFGVVDIAYQHGYITKEEFKEYFPNLRFSKKS